VVAIDAGTTGVRAIAFNHRGLPVSSSYREFTQFFPQPGWVEHDANEIWAAIQVILAELKKALDAAGETIAAIGITDQRETIVAWDRSTGQPRHRAIVWQDRRTADYCAQLESDGALDLVRSTTGLVLDPYFSGTKAHWLFTEGGVTPDDSVAIGTIDSWLAWNLSGGRHHVTDVSNASRTLLLNLGTGEWDEPMLDLLRIPRACLPTVRPSSADDGLRAHIGGVDVPLTALAGDQQSALFGQGCLEPGMAKNTYGTGCFMLMHTGAAPLMSKHRLLTTLACTLGPLQYAIEGSVFVGGAVVQWLRDGLGFVKHASEIEALATSVPDHGGVYVVPAFTGLGSPHWDPFARGAIAGITRGTTRGHIARASLESIAFQSAELLQAMQLDAGRPLRELRVDGGAARNDFLMQFQADLLGVPVVRPANTETTALGAAYLAGLAVGYWKSTDAITAQWRVDRRFEPRISRDEAAARLREWAKAVERSRGWAGG
jgi:glycerol kinase